MYNIGAGLNRLMGFHTSCLMYSLTLSSFIYFDIVGRHDIATILLKVTLKTNQSICQSIAIVGFNTSQSRQ